MLRPEQLDSLRGVVSELAETQTKIAACLSRIQDILVADVDGDSVDGQLPRADENRFCVIWHNQSCHLGHTKSFRLFARLLRQPDHYVSYDRLLHDVWDDDIRSSDTVRSAVRHLKAKLSQVKMTGLARCIRGQGRHYGLILHPG